MNKTYLVWLGGSVFFLDKFIQSLILSRPMGTRDIYNYSVCFYPVLNDSNNINTPTRILLLIILAGCLLILLKHRPSTGNLYLHLGVGLVAGGALSNSVSWIFLGFVVDYIGFFTPGHDLVFNLADLAYFFGIVLVQADVAREVFLILKKRVPGN
ncbi:MAG: lipoprotein signal peptidase [Firmicutes bacterium ADurb.Bin456]|nr:MAG: lipoprotein signal peptidase [Firmicutes bacterium ADurb.Bin456]